MSLYATCVCGLAEGETGHLRTDCPHYGDAPMTTDNPTPEAVGELVEALRRGEWWQTVVQGPNPTSFTTDLTHVARQAADALEAALERPHSKEPTDV